MDPEACRRLGYSEIELQTIGRDELGDDRGRRRKGSANFHPGKDIGQGLWQANLGKKLPAAGARGAREVGDFRVHGPEPGNA